MKGLDLQDCFMSVPFWVKVTQVSSLARTGLRPTKTENTNGSPCCLLQWTCHRYRPRFFDQVGHQTTYASMGNKSSDLPKIMNRADKNWAHF